MAETATTQCGTCGHVITYSDEQGGRTVNCPECGDPVRLREVVNVTADAWAEPVAKPASPPLPMPVKAFFGCGGLMVLVCGGCLSLSVVASMFDNPFEDKAAIQAEAERAEQEAIQAIEVEQARKAQAAAEINAARERNIQREANQNANAKLTPADFAQCKIGMTYDEVVAIIGEPGDDAGDVYLNGVRTQTFIWSGGPLHPDDVFMTFDNGVLAEKSE
ncbi:DUF3862 domain-containing protein [Allorhodopirellula heiligendammensis]|uniref:SmpA / OmlA family protein n=1 Tax=Allorhodopirellula heiligendammensis TaxID=2714739 RepID=A0A5C6C1I3_9BACT|nr:DUF3862 domain-containing protein [Allorhodopirellula heiligendammensis]TWU18028.1 hypothetical protein Poly21_01810 [Allorhodopirellula heiligendammensis]